MLRSFGPWDRLTVPQLSLAPGSQGLIQKQEGGCREVAGRTQSGHHFPVETAFSSAVLSGPDSLWEVKLQAEV